MELPYLAHYPPHLVDQVKMLVEKKQLGGYILSKYPKPQEMLSDKLLYDYVQELKSANLRNAPPLSKVVYDSKINDLRQALGTHTFVSNVQGSKLKAKNIIKVATLFKNAPEDFLRMIVVHELAHFKEKEHNKRFYKLCEHMEPNYHQLEFDTRIYLTHIELFGTLYQRS